MKAFNPVAQWFFLLIPLMLFLSIRAYLRGKEGLRRIGGVWRFEDLFNVYLFKTFFSRFCFFLFFVFALLALADFRGGDRLVEDDRAGFEAVLLMDISRSMLARDIEPSRLGRAVVEAGKFIERNAESRFGVVVFKGEASVLLPVTGDTNSLELMLSNLTTGMLTAPGSNVEKGIRAALDSFQSAGRYRLILLFSDGEALEGDAASAAREASRRGTPIVAVATGTEEGSEIVLGTEGKGADKTGGRVVDRNGTPVVSKLNRNALTEIAELSGGRLYGLEEIGRLGTEMLAITKNLGPGEVKQGLKLVKREMYRLFLLISLFFLTFSVIIRAVRWKKLI
ncbi:MAG TPA: VWA domain-containing protein [Spirochaetia bacterium]|nr:VWA domain-containing protein [Spirochaetia bacterium]